jgi:hypothetical protein
MIRKKSLGFGVWGLGLNLKPETRNLKHLLRVSVSLCLCVFLFAAFILSLMIVPPAICQEKTMEPAAVIALEGVGPCHVQGIAVAGDYLFASCVERKGRKALVYRWRLPAGFPAGMTALSGPVEKDVTAGARYHASGLDRDEQCLWVAAAHYRAFKASSKIICLDPESLAEKKSFELDDHIGAVAVMGETIVGFNWDAKDIYRFTKDGKQLGKDPSPGSVAYQDCKGISDREVLCSGSKKIAGANHPAAVVERLRFDPALDPHWRVQASTLIAHPELNLGNEGFTPWKNFWLFLPEDFPHARVFLYQTP